MFFTIYKFSQNFSREKLQRKSDCSKFEEGTNTLFFENVSICIHFRFHHQGSVLIKSVFKNRSIEKSYN